MTHPQLSRNALITGGNRGIGFATAKRLAARGVRVIIAARDADRGRAAADEIVAGSPGAQVEVMKLDLASLDAVREFADAFRARGLPLHILINNAGAIGLGKEMHFTQDGFELEFGINHLGHFLLTRLLLPALTDAGASRVITVSSIRHIPGRGGQGARFDFDNLRGEKGYDPRIFYNNAKLANVWFAYELQRRAGSAGVTSVAACPGFVPETLASGKTGLRRLFYTRVLGWVPGARTAEVAGEELATLAADAPLTGGSFYANGKPARSSDVSYDASLAGRLWEVSERMTGVTGSFVEVFRAPQALSAV